MRLKFFFPQLRIPCQLLSLVRFPGIHHSGMGAVLLQSKTGKGPLTFLFRHCTLAKLNASQVGFQAGLTTVSWPKSDRSRFLFPCHWEADLTSFKDRRQTRRHVSEVSNINNTPFKRAPLFKGYVDFDS